MRGQITTWYQHAFIAAAAPIVVVLVVGTYNAALPTALVVGLFFWVREYLDEKAHRAAGDWETPEPGTGITPRADREGDMLGPWTVLLCYLLLELLRMVS